MRRLEHLFQHGDGRNDLIDWLIAGLFTGKIDECLGDGAHLIHLQPGRAQFSQNGHGAHARNHAGQTAEKSAAATLFCRIGIYGFLRAGESGKNLLHPVFRTFLIEEIKDDRHSLPRLVFCDTRDGGNTLDEFFHFDLLDLRRALSRLLTPCRNCRIPGRPAHRGMTINCSNPRAINALGLPCPRQDGEMNN